MPEERYLKIGSCAQCPFTGHTSNRHNRTIKFVCCNPINMGINMPKCGKELINDVYYPITHVTEDRKDNPIPEWCKLPSKVE